MARGWDTQTLAREQIAKLTGWRIPQSVYAEWESGRRLPSEANLDRLRSFYGDAPQSTETPDSLVTALTAQTAALDRHTAKLDELLAAVLGLAGITPYEPLPETPAAAPRRALPQSGR